MGKAGARDRLETGVASSPDPTARSACARSARASMCSSAIADLPQERFGSDIADGNREALSAACRTSRRCRSQWLLLFAGRPCAASRRSAVCGRVTRAPRHRQLLQPRPIDSAACCTAMQRATHVPRRIMDGATCRRSRSVVPHLPAALGMDPFGALEAGAP